MKVWVGSASEPCCKIQETLMTAKIPVGILGATGIVGQRFVQMLEHHPWFEVAWLAASDRSEGRPYAEAARWKLKTPIPARVAEMKVAPATTEGAPKVIFAALDASIAAEMEPRFAASRMRCSDQLQRLAYAKRRSAGDSGSQSRSHQAARMSGMAQEIRRLRCNQSELLRHWIGAGVGSPRTEHSDWTPLWPLPCKL